MFVLRRIEPDGTIENSALGENYKLITRRGADAEFKKEFEFFWNEKYGDKKETFGFVRTFNKTIPLFKGKFYFIMTGDGQTFESIKDRD